MITISLFTTSGGAYHLEVEEGTTVEAAAALKNVNLQGTQVRLQSSTGGASRLVNPTEPVQAGQYVVSKNVSNG